MGLIDYKSIAKEVLESCKRERPNEFKDVTIHDVMGVMNLLQRNIFYCLETRSMLAIRDSLIIRPNLSKMAKRQRVMNQKLDGFKVNILPIKRRQKSEGGL